MPDAGFRFPSCPAPSIEPKSACGQDRPRILCRLHAGSRVPTAKDARPSTGRLLPIGFGENFPLVAIRQHREAREIELALPDRNDGDDA